MTINAVIFDLDDTLYLERDYAFSGFDAVAVAFSDVLGEPKASAAKMRALFDSKHRRRVFDQLLDDCTHKPNENIVEQMIETFRHHAPTIRLLPEADDAIVRLAPIYKLGLITDGPAIMQRAKIDALGLAKRLDKLIVTDELGDGAGKPNPLSYNKISETLSVAPNECVYVADNPAKDFVAPNALAWLTVQIVRPQGIYKDAPPAAQGAPAKTIDSLDELDPLLK